MEEMNTPRVSQEDLDLVRDENHRKEKEFKREIVTDWLPRYTGMPLD